MSISIQQLDKNTLAANLSTRDNLRATKIQDTISLAYYGLCQGDISALNGCSSDIRKELESTYLKYIPAKYDTEQNKWVFVKTKASKMRDKLDIKIQATFEEFLVQLNTLETANELVKEMEAERETEQMKAQKADTKVTKYLQKQIDDGMTIEHLQSLLATMKSKQSKVTSDQAEFDKRLQAKLAA